jgi:hypothetical protein
MSIESLGEPAKSATQPTFDGLFLELLSDVHLALREAGQMLPKKVLVGVECDVKRGRRRCRKGEPAEYNLSLCALNPGSVEIERDTFAITSEMDVVTGAPKSLSLRVMNKPGSGFALDHTNYDY